MAEPSAVLRVFGGELKYARESAGLTQEQLGDKVAYSRGQIGMVENGQRFMKADTVKLCDEILSTDGLLFRLWKSASEDRSVIRFAHLIDAERRANAIRSFHPVYVPGLLQVESYARSLMDTGRFYGATQNEIDERVAIRMERQRILADGRLRAYTVVLDEAVLHHLVGDRSVMREQLMYLLASTRHKFIKIQLMPFASFSFPVSGPITIFDIDGAVPVVHLDGPGVFQTTTDAIIAERCIHQFDVLRSQAASLYESVRILESRLEEL